MPRPKVSKFKKIFSNNLKIKKYNYIKWMKYLNVKNVNILQKENII